MSAVITKKKFEDIIAKGSGRVQLGHTFSGHSLGAAALLAVQKKVQNPLMLAHINIMGELIRTKLNECLSNHPFFVQTRGRGLNTALEYKCKNVHLFSLELQERMKTNHSILINAKWHRTTFTPAFIISEDQVNLVIDLFCQEFLTISKDWH